jgi:hypothetical protein
MFPAPTAAQSITQSETSQFHPHPSLNQTTSLAAPHESIFSLTAGGGEQGPWLPAAKGENSG